METLVDVKIRPPNGSRSASRKVSGQVSKEVVLSTANKRKMVRQVRTPLLQSGYSWLQTFPSERSSVTSFDSIPNIFWSSLAHATVPEEKTVYQIQRENAENNKQVCLSRSGQRSVFYSTSQGEQV